MRALVPAARILLAAALLGILVTDLARMAAPRLVPPDELLARALPGAVSFLRSEGPVPHWKGSSPDGRPVGAVVLSDEVPPRVRGYAGEMSWAVGMTPGGKIAGVVPFRHRETPFYMVMVLRSGLVETLSSMDVTGDPPPLDAVTGATVTSEALVSDVTAAARETAELVFGLKVPHPAIAAVSPGSLAPWSLAALLAALALSFAAALLPRVPQLNHLSLAAGLAVVGVLLNVPLTLANLAGLLSLDLPGGDALVLLLLATVLCLPFLGRVYCRHLCPFGALQHFLHLFSPWKAPYGPEILRPLPALRQILLAVLLLLAVPLGFRGFAETEPFFSLFTFRLTVLVWIFTVAVVMLSLFWRRFWCNLFCPTGTLLAVASRLFPRRRGRDETV